MEQSTISIWVKIYLQAQISIEVQIYVKCYWKEPPMKKGYLLPYAPLIDGCGHVTRAVNTNQKNVLGDDFWLVDMQDRWKVKNRNAVCSASWWWWASFSYLTCCPKYIVWLMNNVFRNRLHDIFSTQDLCLINIDLNCSTLINFYGDDNKYRFDAHFIDI